MLQMHNMLFKHADVLYIHLLSFMHTKPHSVLHDHSYLKFSKFNEVFNHIYKKYNTLYLQQSTAFHVQYKLQKKKLF